MAAQAANAIGRAAMIRIGTGLGRLPATSSVSTERLSRSLVGAVHGGIGGSVSGGVGEATTQILETNGSISDVGAVGGSMVSGAITGAIGGAAEGAVLSLNAAARLGSARSNASNIPQPGQIEAALGGIAAQQSINGLRNFASDYLRESIENTKCDGSVDDGC